MPKKTCKLIIDTGNDYVIAVKGNQQNLHRQIQRNTANTRPTSRYIASERTRNRVTTRTTEVFNDLTGINQQWTGLKSLIKVERLGTRAGKPYHQVVYYISSLIRSAVDFACGIRGHWGIENRLHWGGSAVGGFPDLRRLPFKDVVFDEDNSTIRTGNAPANLSIVRSLALNILRRNGYSSITSAYRFLSNDIDKLLYLVG
ncbi:ISAs1 family transposase [Brasilonema octagenarum UFV-E1]|uniref:ISAs1 family transposase n=2 Tax=Brasilonema TaxID=383614 RepID=A0A856MF52_9CYAN|nr:ISAs1 family transposase [Brasilonema sennae]NMF61989.1 ISAs1 family transposase [Brasilonema octagenarum UFV-OR1]QDL08291.1 ISAs1 family transposase [Brasilonema sennae CENA114]QDL14648.1 ISAs1 family transposase [Brasilonema octagenarum UFV-E1]